jgi:hypothetical protein
MYPGSRLGYIKVPFSHTPAGYEHDLLSKSITIGTRHLHPAPEGTQEAVSRTNKQTNKQEY